MKSYQRALAVASLCAIASTAQAYVRETTEGSADAGYWLWWRTRGFSYAVNANSYSGPCTDAGIEDAIRTSFATWAGATYADAGSACTDLVFTELDGGTTRTDLGYDSSRSDGNLNLIVFRKGRCAEITSDARCTDAGSDWGPCIEANNCWAWGSAVLALTTVTSKEDTGELIDSDIEVNGWNGDSASPTGRYFTCASSSTVCAEDYAGTDCVAYDLQSVITHEAGHMLGLAHSAVDGSTMNATISKGETSKRTLAEDDVEGICSIYPVGGETVTSPGIGSSSGGCDTGGSGAWGLLIPVLAFVRGRRALRRGSWRELRAPKVREASALVYNKR